MTFWRDFSRGMIAGDVADSTDPTIRSHTAGRISNMMIAYDGSAVSRQGTERLRHRFVGKSYLFGLDGLRFPVKFMTISSSKVTFFDSAHDSTLKSIDSLWAFPESCVVQVWQDWIIVLSPDVFPQVIDFVRGSARISNYAFAQSEDGETLRPYISIKFNPPSLIVSPVKGILAQQPAGQKRFTLETTGFDLSVLVVGMFLRFEGVELKVSKILNSQKVEALQISGGSKADALNRQRASTNWQVEAFHQKFGFPTAACFFQSRLVLGGSKSFPNTLWLSDIGRADRFGTEVLPDKSFTIRIQGRRTKNKIIHLIDAKDLLVMTECGIFAVLGQSLTRLDSRVIPLHQLVVDSTLPVRVLHSIVVRDRQSGYFVRLTYDHFNQRLYGHTLDGAIKGQIAAGGKIFFDAKRHLLIVCDGTERVWSARIPTSSSARAITPWSYHYFGHYRITGGAMIDGERFLFLHSYAGSTETGEIRLWENPQPLDRVLRHERLSQSRLNNRLKENFGNTQESIDIIAEVEMGNQKIVGYIGSYDLSEILSKASQIFTIQRAQYYLGHRFEQSIVVRPHPLGVRNARHNIKTLQTRSLTVRMRKTIGFDLLFPGNDRPKTVVVQWQTSPGYLYLLPYSGDVFINCSGLTHLTPISHNTDGNDGPWAWKISSQRPLSMHVVGVLEQTQ